MERIYEYDLPRYLAIGVLEENFWDSCPKELEPYIKAENLRFKNENFKLWLQGVYTREAVGVAVNNNLGGKAKYFEKPIDFDGVKEEEREFTEEEKLELQKKVLLQLQVMELNYKHGNHEEH